MLLFSFDGVIGAFAISKDILSLLGLGLVAGAKFDGVFG